jgi:hypothetical protein
MLYAKLLELGCKELPSTLTEDAYSLSELSLLLSVDFPPILKELYSLHARTMIFEKGAVFKPVEATPVDDTEGFQELEILYGLNKGPTGLFQKNKMYSQQFPEGFLTIGGAPGGNQICMHRKNPKVSFFYHEAQIEGTAFYEIAETLETFLQHLTCDIDRGKISARSGIVKSVLDF